MSLSIVCSGRNVVIRDGVVQRRMYRRLIALLPQQLVRVERVRRRRRQVQQGRGWAAAVAVRHAAPLLHRASRPARAHATHAGVGPIVRIASAHYHTVVLLGGHGAANTIRARTHFTLHFTTTVCTHFDLHLLF